MITIKVEKEIDLENKVMLGLTFRQLICAFAVIVGCVLCKLLDLPQVFFMSICFALGALAYFIGWKKVNGVTYDKIALKKVKTTLWSNEKRKYRTKNRYITMYNTGYKRDKLADMNDKKTAKYIKKMEKRKVRKQKHSKLKSYV